MSVASSGTTIKAPSPTTCVRIESGIVYHFCDPTLIDGSTTSPNMSRGTAEPPYEPESAFRCRIERISVTTGDGPVRLRDSAGRHQLSQSRTVFERPGIISRPEKSCQRTLGTFIRHQNLGVGSASGASERPPADPH